ncbi:class I adenylate-forming enzyme family protein [Croceibacterium salegens]|uniref:class I adenylate-forming enzyme family protein n=1 Tax=Croceibacterium salegens TaxID=1737568 RepID=UPI00135C1CA6|nr:AMP-binding protein [Croceibacterium salegens]
MAKHQAPADPSGEATSQQQSERVACNSEFTDMLAAFEACVRERPDGIAVYYFDRSFTYAELEQQSRTAAHWLIDAGVKRGDRVSIVLQNMPQFVVMTIAAWRIGAIPVPGNPMYKGAEMARIFADCEPSVVLCLDTCHSEMAAALDIAEVPACLLVTSSRAYQSRNDERVIPAQIQINEAVWFEDVLAIPNSKPLPEIAYEPADLGLILYTSGTTGVPKGAMITHHNLAFNGEALDTYCHLDAGSRILALAPLFHITGMSCHFAASLCARAAMILQYRVEPSLLLDTIKEHRPTYTIGAITAFNALMNVPGIMPEDVSSFDRVYSGGAPIPPSLLKAIKDKLHISIHSAYGMTESTAHTHISPFGADIPVDPTSGALSIGKVMPCTAARVIGDDGLELPCGEVGELLLKGPQVMAGYWRRPDETASALQDGWMHTGDVAFVDADGWYYLVDRIKDVIIASGFKVWPREVEDVLYEHPAVREAAVVGAPDAYRGETVRAFVSLVPGTTVEPQDLVNHCRDRLAAYKAPSCVEIRGELPKTVTGKIQRLALRQEFAGN